MRRQSGWEEVSKAAVCALHFPARPAQQVASKQSAGTPVLVVIHFNTFMLHAFVKYLPSASVYLLASVLGAAQVSCSCRDVFMLQQCINRGVYSEPDVED